MADAVDAREAAPAPPMSKASAPPSMPQVSIEYTPTEPATSPRMMEVPVNDGRWTQADFDALVRKAAQAFNNKDIDRLRQWEIEDAVQREKEAHERSIKEWEARFAAQELKDHHDIPPGPPPSGTSSMRVLPDVHAALRQNDPSRATHSQPVLKKAPPSMGRPMPAGFYSDTNEPPRIGTPVQPPPPTTSRPEAAQFPGLNLPLAATPMTPSHPPRPPIEALPKYASMETSPGANKHPLEQPAQACSTQGFST